MKLRLRLSVESLPDVIVLSEIVSSSSWRLSDFSMTGSRAGSAPGVDCSRASELWVREGRGGVSGGEVTWLVLSNSPSTLCVRNGGDVSLRRRARDDVIGLVGGRQAGVSGLDDLRRL